MLKGSLYISAIATGIVLHSLFASSIALAQSTAPQPPAASTGATARPDVVKLKNGGLVRGTIDANIPGQYVVIMMPSGESQRFNWSEVDYAGPATQPASASPATTPAPTSPAVTADEPDAVRTPMHPVRIAGIVTAATGGAALSVGLLMGAIGSSASRELDKLCDADNICGVGTATEQRRVDELMAEDSRYNNAAVIIAGTGLVAIAAGVVLIVASPRSKPETVATTWHVVPNSQNADLGGLSIAGTF